jgi:putative proteasome-type protease
MTYCLGMLLRQGLIMMADTRTNAGVDNLATYRKLRILGDDARGVFALASAGSLSTTQIAIERALEGIVAPDTGAVERIGDATRIHRVAFLLGQAVRITTRDWKAFTEVEFGLDAALLVGGSLGGEPTRLFMVYGAGNFIECGPETPYLQIGERKFGQPILDRGLSYETELYEGLKIGLVSYLGTMRSNTGVDLPIDIMVARNGQPRAELIHRIAPDDAYFHELGGLWAEAIGQALAGLPAPPYRSSATAASAHRFHATDERLPASRPRRIGGPHRSRPTA